MAKSNVIQFLVLVVVLAVLGVVGFVAYSIANEVKNKTKEKLEKKNVSFSKEGMKVAVKPVSQEQQESQAQSVLTKVWSNASTPNYKGPTLGWGSGGKTSSAAPAADKRSPFSRSSSSAQNVPTLSKQTNLSK